MRSILVAILAMLVLPSVIMPGSQASTGNLIGTTTTWYIDTDIDGTWDGTIVMANVTSIGYSIGASSLRCVISFSNMSGVVLSSISGSVTKWDDVTLVIDDMNDTDEDDITVVLGVSRTYVTRHGIMNGVNTTFVHDKETGLLVSAYVYNGTCSCNKLVILTIIDTSAFMHAGMITQPMIWVVIVIVASAVIYTAYVVIKDKNARKNKACFGSGCWE